MPSGDFAGTIAGTAYTGADGGFDMLAPEDDRIGGTPYTITAGSLLIFALS